MQVKWIIPLYGFGGEEVVGQPHRASTRMAAMGEELGGTDDIVAVHIPNTCSKAEHRGRILGVLKLAVVEPGKDLTSYAPRYEWNNDRWPVGLPVSQPWLKFPDKLVVRLDELVPGTCRPGNWPKLGYQLHGQPVRIADGVYKPLADALNRLVADNSDQLLRV